MGPVEFRESEEHTVWGFPLVCGSCGLKLKREIGGKNDAWSVIKSMAVNELTTVCER